MSRPARIDERRCQMARSDIDMCIPQLAIDITVSQ